jgi:vacuolar-type H+-ATPase subunit I/STV1
MGPRMCQKTVQTEEINKKYEIMLSLQKKKKRATIRRETTTRRTLESIVKRIENATGDDSEERTNPEGAEKNLARGSKMKSPDKKGLSL